MLGGDVVASVNGLKQDGDGTVAVLGSGVLVQALIEHNLIGEYRLFAHPLKTNRDVEWVVKTPDGPTEVGTTLRARGKSLGRSRETTMRFTAIVPNEKIEFEAEVGPMRPNCAFIFDQTHGGTTVTFQGDPNPVGPFKLLSPLFTRIGQQVWAQRLARAKTALEAPAS